ncbi:hypothetical protein R6Q57_025034 [Mikania cordata]
MQRLFLIWVFVKIVYTRTKLIDYLVRESYLLFVKFMNQQGFVFDCCCDLKKRIFGCVGSRRRRVLVRYGSLFTCIIDFCFRLDGSCVGFFRFSVISCFLCSICCDVENLVHVRLVFFLL